MGQQQLLLLVLGIVIVSVATMSGIDAFAENMDKAEADRERQKMLDMVASVQAWKLKPSILGGGSSTDESDFSNFTLASLGFKSNGGPDDSPFVEIYGVGCFRFFPRNTDLQINALNDDCVIGSWDKGIVVTGTDVDDISWVYP